MAEPNVHQLLITRFNIRARGAGYRPDQPADWIEHRYRLFERYCAPSVVAQIEQDFEWLIFCDEETPQDLLDRISAVDKHVRIELLPAIGPSSDLLHMRHYARPDADVVVSTRLDNDDALSRRALRRVREYVDVFLAEGHPRAIFNPRIGYKLEVETGTLYAGELASNAFLSMLERVPEGGPLLGAYSSSHVRMQNAYPTFQEMDERLWLQIIHGRNVSNSIRRADRVIEFDELGADFVVSADVVAQAK